MKKILFICIGLSFGFFGCGSSEGELSTSTITATVDTAVMDSDIIKWTDQKACTGASIPPADSVNVSVVSKAYSNTGSMGLPIRIESATISYTPANSSTPAMPSEFQTIGSTIANGSTVTVPVRVSTQEQKERLINALACGGPIYNYYTKITLNISEIGTDKKTTTDVSMQLRFADFIDK
jgi:hypothetical protein